ncbi:MAG: DoxX-like family [Blastocatellia bacterium]|jgi:hypothetical protein|nr:DoxX-like family [Blastocatellia bacterium]
MERVVKQWYSHSQRQAGGSDRKVRERRTVGFTDRRSLMFLMAGFSKLLGNEQMVGLFALAGFGQWFRYLTGTLEGTPAAADV